MCRGENKVFDLGTSRALSLNRGQNNHGPDTLKVRVGPLDYHS